MPEFSTSNSDDRRARRTFSFENGLIATLCDLQVRILSAVNGKDVRDPIPWWSCDDGRILAVNNQRIILVGSAPYPNEERFGLSSIDFKTRMEQHLHPFDADVFCGDGNGSLYYIYRTTVCKFNCTEPRLTTWLIDNGTLSFDQICIDHDRTEPRLFILARFTLRIIRLKHNGVSQHEQTVSWSELPLPFDNFCFLPGNRLIYSSWENLIEIDLISEEWREIICVGHAICSFGVDTVSGHALLSLGEISDGSEETWCTLDISSLITR